MAITYRGTTLPFAKHSDETTARATKEVAYPAVDGVQLMHMGKRVRPILVEGRITDLAGSFNKDTIEGWNDTNTGTLVIHAIATHTYVRMARCSFGEAYTDAVTGKLCCTYAIEFVKLR